MKDTELMEDGPGVKVLAKLKPQPNWFLVATRT